MSTPAEPIVGIALGRAQYTFRQAIEVELRPKQLSVPMAGILVSLAQEDGMCGAELARREAVTAQTLNQLVARLVKRGLGERRRHATHGRMLTLPLTAAGRHALAARLASAAAAQHRVA